MTAEQKPARTYPSEDALRAEAVRIACYACDGDKGRVFGDPVFDAVTEGRQKWKGYSACGDLPHYVLRELGFRDERILNREDDGGVLPWKIGANLSRIVFNPLGAFVWASGGIPTFLCLVDSANRVCESTNSLTKGVCRRLHLPSQK